MPRCIAHTTTLGNARARCALFMDERPDDKFDRLIHAWRVPVEPDPALTSQVWARVGKRRRRFAFDWRLLYWRLEGLCARPGFVVLFILICAIIGVVAAQVQVNNFQTEKNREMAIRYIKLVDPLTRVEVPEAKP